MKKGFRPETNSWRIAPGDSRFPGLVARHHGMGGAVDLFAQRLRLQNFDGIPAGKEPWHKVLHLECRQRQDRAPARPVLDAQRSGRRKFSECVGQQRLAAYAHPLEGRGIPGPTVHVPLQQARRHRAKALSGGRDLPQLRQRDPENPSAIMTVGQQIPSRRRGEQVVGIRSAGSGLPPRGREMHEIHAASFADGSRQRSQQP